MATNKTIPNLLPPGAEQLVVVDDVTGQIENVSRTTMDRQTVNNRVGQARKKTNNAFAAGSAPSPVPSAQARGPSISRFHRRANFPLTGHGARAALEIRALQLLNFGRKGWLFLVREPI